MAEIKFYANVLGDTGSTLIEHTLGSGLGFYGSSFGVSVPVGSQQRTTYVTDANGTSQGVQLNNTAMNTSGTILAKGTVSINGSTPIDLDKLPNYLCPLNLRFTHSTPVRVQNCKLRIFDRNDISKPASGVSTYVYEARHPSNSQVVTSLGFRANKDVTASAGFKWTEFDPTLAQPDLPLTNSPGVSGLNTDTTDTDVTLGYTSRSGISLTATRHDWYVALSSEPQSIGSKTNYGLYFTVEYI
jgi:hypothetical protein